MNKILQSGSTGEINVTNDGATILKAIQLDNAAAKILVNISKVQDDEVGDGTTSVCVLAAELLREAEKLIAMKIHPQTIVEGFRIASAAALQALEKAAIDNRSVHGSFMQVSQPNLTLRNVARTRHSSGRICSTLHERRSRQKSSLRIKTTLPTLLSTQYFDSRYALTDLR